MSSNDKNHAEARLAAMNLLARREHSRQELTHKLSRKFSDILVFEVVRRLVEEGLQSDRRFAEAFVRQRAQRGYGPLRIRQEIRQRGLTDSDLEHAFAECDIDWLECLAEVIVRKYGDSQPGDLKEKAKRQRFLLYRGFSSDQIRDFMG